VNRKAWKKTRGGERAVYKRKPIVGIENMRRLGLRNFFGNNAVSREPEESAKMQGRKGVGSIPKIIKGMGGCPLRRDNAGQFLKPASCGKRKIQSFGGSAAR